MTKVIPLPIQKRDRAGKGAARAIRRQGLVPGVIYGDKQPALLIAMDPRPLYAQLKRSGFYTHQYDLVVGDGEETHRVMAQDVQFHVVTDAPIHVDFLRIGKDSVVSAEIAIHFTNQDKSPGLKKGGILNIVVHELAVVGRPDDLPEDIVVDLTGLDIGGSVHLSDLTLPEGVRAGLAGEATIVTIAPPAGEG